MPKIIRMKTRLIRGAFLAAAVWAVLGPWKVWAGYDYKMDTLSSQAQGNYEAQMSAKLTRGANNLFLGWTEILRRPTDMAQGPGKNFFKVVFAGVPYGIFTAAGRTLLGAYEIVTFWAPQRPLMRPIDGDVL